MSNKWASVARVGKRGLMAGYWLVDHPKTKN